MKSPAKGLMLACGLGALLLGCSSVSDAGPSPTGGDLDWARDIADRIIADLYDTDFILYSVEATLLDEDGFLYDDAQHPYWRLLFINPELLVQVVVHPGGSATVIEEESFYENEVELTFTSSDVAAWLELARYCYRYITGRADDVCYGLNCTCLSNGSTSVVTLYDENLVKLALVIIDAEEGRIVYFELL